MISATRHGGGGHGHAAAQFRASGGVRAQRTSVRACVRVCLGYRLASTTTTVLDWDSVTQVVSILIPVSLPRIPDPDLSTVSKAEYPLRIICYRP
jgi:hypothetical protein